MISIKQKLLSIIGLKVRAVQFGYVTKRFDLKMNFKIIFKLYTLKKLTIFFSAGFFYANFCQCSWVFTCGDIALVYEHFFTLMENSIKKHVLRFLLPDTMPVQCTEYTADDLMVV